MNTADTSNGTHFLQNVHLGLPDPTLTGKSYLVRGNYSYFHYGCDGYSDAVSVSLE